MESKLPEGEVLRALTLTNLLIVMAFTTTVSSVFIPIRATHSGALRYCVGIVLGLIAGTCVVCFEWQILKYLFVRASNASKATETLISVMALCFMVIWLVVGGSVGAWLGSLMLKHVG